jgi:HAD superfamily hydrolase (TIGR01509 family)
VRRTDPFWRLPQWNSGMGAARSHLANHAPDACSFSPQGDPPPMLFLEWSWGEETLVMTKTIFWDNDGVLVDTERFYFLATRSVLASVGIELTKQQYIEYFLVQGKGAWHLASGQGISAETIEQLRRQRNALYENLLAQEQLLIDGVTDVLETLHKRYVMGIVTSSHPDHFATIHRRTGILPYFQFALMMGDYTHSKPHPEPYLRAVDRSGCRKEECLVIEDSERGLKAAMKAGIRCIVVPSEFTRGSTFTGAYRVFESLSELLPELS